MIKHRRPTAASAICLIVLTNTHTLSILTSDLGLLTAQRATEDSLFRRFIQTLHSRRFSHHSTLGRFTDDVHLLRNTTHL